MADFESVVDYSTKLNNLDQTATPLATALEIECNKSMLAYDVPGHKGNIEELKVFFGEIPEAIIGPIITIPSGIF